MAKGCSASLKLFTLALCLCAGRSFMDISTDLLEFCKDEIGIEACVHESFDTSITLYDVFVIMTTNVTRLEDLCQDTTVRLFGCIGPCILEFRSSVYSYLYHVCSFKRWIEWEEPCWTEQWAIEAILCHMWLYPSQLFVTVDSLPDLYPEPYRPYDRASISRDCFPSAAAAGDKCPFYQSWVFQYLLPDYYGLHGYPDDFNHIADSIGFPGI